MNLRYSQEIQAVFNILVSFPNAAYAHEYHCGRLS